MDCPRCGAPNLPGLPACVDCVDCGQDMDAEPEVPQALVPDVCVANPLREKRAKPPRDPLIHVHGFRPFAHVGRMRHLPWHAFIEGMFGVVRGTIPGLMPALRRERRAAGIQLAAFFVPIAVLLLGGGVDALGSSGFLVAAGWSLSPFQEARRSMDTPEPHRALVAFWLTLGPVALFTFGLAAAIGQLQPPVFFFTGNGSVLPGRRFEVERAELETLQAGELVVFERSDVEHRVTRLGALLGAGVLVAAGEVAQPPAAESVHRYLDRYRRSLDSYDAFASPVVAVEGQLLQHGQAVLLVDGAPSTAVPITSWSRWPLGLDLRDNVVPPGHVAVWDWIPYPDDTTLHISLVPADLVVGRITHRVREGLSTVPLRWPEDADLAPEDPLEVP